MERRRRDLHELFVWVVRNGGVSVRLLFLGNSMRLALMAGLMALAPCSAFGQGIPFEIPNDPSRVESGDSLRLKFPLSRPVTAVFLGWDADRMRLQVDGMTEVWPVSVYDLARLEVFTERTRREGLRHYAVLGAATGLFAGAGIGLVLHATGISEDPGGAPEQIVTNTLRWAGFGIIGGFLTGGYFGGRSPGTGWISLSLPTRE